jgi:aminoglycoside phosphotransferase (APT) family kinase protein
MSVFNFETMTPITKGWSGDAKYFVTAKDGRNYLLRISPKEKHDSKKVEFEMMQQVAALGVPMCQPIEFGICDQDVYSLQSWIEGKEAEEVIPYLPDTEQYSYGFQAGQILKKIHSVQISSIQEDWDVRFNRKIERKIQKYNDCPIKYENGQFFIDYINANRHLLKNRPQCYQHGDYHIGNMMIDEEGKLQIIDFDRDDYGDPWEEFNRIVWCAKKAPLFASGMVNGYFDNKVPMEFWKLLVLYISSNTLSSIPWAIPFGQDEIDTMINQAKDILIWYDNMKNPVPTWYSGTFFI